MAQKKERKIDAVTIVGLALAIAIFLGGNTYLRNKQNARLEWERTHPAQPITPSQVEQERVIAGGGVQSPLGTQNPGAEKDPHTEEVATQEVEPIDSGDIKITTVPQSTGLTQPLEFVFTALGASVKHASITEAYIDPSKKNGPQGLEILSEIEPGKRTFNLSDFEIGPPGSERQNERIKFNAITGPLKSLDRRIWNLDNNSNRFNAAGHWTLVYSTTVSQKYTVTKTYTIYNDSQYLTLDISVTNKSDQPVSYNYVLFGPAGILLDGPPHNPKGDAYVSIRAELAGRDASATGQPSIEPEVKQVDPLAAAIPLDEDRAVSHPQNLWAAIKNRFYMAVFISMDPAQLIKLRAEPIKNDPQASDLRLAEPNLAVVGVRRLSPKLDAGVTSGSDHYALYVGPCNEDNLNRAESQLMLAQPIFMENSVQYCDIFNYRWPRVDWLARKMMWLFRGLRQLFGSYGLAVIFLTLTIKLCLHPLQRKMMISMSKMQKIQPELKKLQAKYKNQTSTQAKQKMMFEQQDLMKKAGASPVAGCLPMFIQLPVFSALYGIFNHAFEMRGAEFLWIKDLSQQDHLMDLPFWPGVVNLLPIIYIGVTLLQSKLSPLPKSDDPQQEMNRKMMMFMPLMISFMFYRMPAGLVLYFAASAIFGMFETWYIKKYLIKDVPLQTTSVTVAKAL